MYTQFIINMEINELSSYCVNQVISLFFSLYKIKCKIMNRLNKNNAYKIFIINLNIYFLM